MRLKNHASSTTPQGALFSRSERWPSFKEVARSPFGGGRFYSYRESYHKHTLTHRVKLCVSYYRYYCQLLLTVNDRASFLVSCLAVVFIFANLPFPSIFFSSISFEEPSCP